MEAPPEVVFFPDDKVLDPVASEGDEMRTPEDDGQCEGLARLCTVLADTTSMLRLCLDADPCNAVYACLDNLLAGLGESQLGGGSAGARVRVLLSAGCSAAANPSMLNLMSKGLQARTWTGEGGFQHRFAVLDDQWVINGSFDWSEAQVLERTSTVVFKSKRLALRYADEFEKLWDQGRILDASDLSSRPELDGTRGRGFVPRIDEWSSVHFFPDWRPSGRETKHDTALSTICNKIGHISEPRRGARHCVVGVVPALKADEVLTAFTIAGKKSTVKVRLLFTEQPSAEVRTRLDRANVLFAPVPPPSTLDPDTGKPEQPVRHHFVVVDNWKAFVGPFSWSAQAAKNEHSSLIVHQEETMVNAFRDEFERLWIMAQQT